MDRKTDRELQNEILGELHWDTRVDATHIGVSVEDGVVTLTGRVHSYAEKVAAVAAAHRVAGVLDVANEIHVKGVEELTDSDIAESVRHTLAWDIAVPDDRIHTTVCEAIVTLTGTVDLVAQRDDAVRAVRTVRGVRAVIDNIRVRAPVVDIETVRAAIESALDRRVARETQRLALAVDGSTVTLSGIVHTWAEHKAALGAAWGTRGVERVIDDLQIVA